MKEYKFVVMGGGGVGKSAIAKRYDPTIEDSWRKLVYLENDPIRLEILDTAGTEQFTAMRDLYFRNGDGFLFVYSICSLDTLREVQELLEQYTALTTYSRTANSSKKSRLPIIMVGNKIDMSEDRQIPLHEAQELAAEWNIGHIETSAKMRINVDEAFERLLLLVTELEAEERDGSGQRRKSDGVRGLVNGGENKAPWKRVWRRSSQEGSSGGSGGGRCMVM